VDQVPVLQLSLFSIQVSAKQGICLSFLLLLGTANDITESAKTDFLGTTDSLAIQDPPTQFLISLCTFPFTPETTTTCSLQERRIPSVHHLRPARPYNSSNKFFLYWIPYLVAPVGTCAIKTGQRCYKTLSKENWVCRR